jgi:hypothetical protein
VEGVKESMGETEHFVCLHVHEECDAVYEELLRTVIGSAEMRTEYL